MSLQFVVNKPRGPMGWWILAPILGLSAGQVVYDGPPSGVSGDVIRSIYPGLDDPNVLDAAQRLTERRRTAAEAVIAAAAVEERA